MTPRPLHVLIVEDSENDAALLELELERAGYQPVVERVETAEAMNSALQSRTWDLVIADYVLPHFNGLAALAQVRARGLELPFIVVSGHITDATAVAAMKAGAHDYVMKDNLARLGPAVERELREAEVRREQRRAEDRLRVEHSFREAIENSVPAGISAVDLAGRQTYVNPAFCAMVGWTEAELVGAWPPFVYWPPEQIPAITEKLGRVVAGHSPAGDIELRFSRRSGERIDVLLQITPLQDSAGHLTGWVSSASDITLRKRAEVRLGAEHAITRLLANAQSLEQAAPAMVQILLDSLETEFGALWILDAETQQLRPIVLQISTPSPALQSFVEKTQRLRFARGKSVPGLAWQQGQAVWFENLGQAPPFERQNKASLAGLVSAVTFPLQNAGSFFGILEFFTARRMGRDPTLLNMMSAIGSEVGQFIQRRSAEEALRRAHAELESRVQQRTAELKSANAKLQMAILERKRLEHELLEITEKERRRIGFDLHDDLGQRLSGIALMTKGLQLALTKQRRGEADQAGKIYSLVQEAINHTSEVAHDLATLDFREKDLPAALKDLASRARQMFSITCRLKVPPDLPLLDPHAVRQLYKIAQEALTNAIKHGKASRVAVTLVKDKQQLSLSIQNDGRPFPDLKSHSTGMGLRIMNYRASLLGATLEVKSTDPRGTLVTCAMPLGDKAEEQPEPTPPAS